MVGAVALGAPVALAGVADAAPKGHWDRIAKCESGGRWNTATGNGYYGRPAVLEVDLEGLRRQWYAAQGQQVAADQGCRTRAQSAGVEGVAGLLAEARPALTCAAARRRAGRKT